MEQEGNIRILYRFIRQSREPQEIDVWIDEQTLRSKPAINPPYPEWARIGSAACEGCEWAESEYCPIAVRLAHPLTVFRDAVSYEPVLVEVETDQRFYRKEVDMQQGLSSLFGLLMATSGCPSMAIFRPMARYHLPFASFEETFFRISGSYLLRELINGTREIDYDSVINGLNNVYRQVSRVNESVMHMLRKSDEEMADSSANAIALLAAVSGMIPLTAESQLQGIERLFR